MATDPQNFPFHRRNGIRTLQAFAVMLSLTVTGCAGDGMLYTRVVHPYFPDFHATPVGSKECRVNKYTIKEPVSSANVSVSFTLRVMQETAREAGITNLYYADIETFSIMNGIYKRDTLILHGD